MEEVKPVAEVIKDRAREDQSQDLDLRVDSFHFTCECQNVDSETGKMFSTYFRKTAVNRTLSVRRCYPDAQFVTSESHQRQNAYKWNVHQEFQVLAIFFILGYNFGPLLR